MARWIEMVERVIRLVDEGSTGREQESWRDMKKVLPAHPDDRDEKFQLVEQRREHRRSVENQEKRGGDEHLSDELGHEMIRNVPAYQ